MAKSSKINSGIQFPDFLQRLADDAVVLQARLRAQMHSDNCAGGDDATKCCIAAKGGLVSTKAFGEVVKAAMDLGREIRQWDGHIKTNLDRMTDGQKARVVVQFIEGLPISGRRDIYQVLASKEAARPDGLGLTVVDKFE